MQNDIFFQEARKQKEKNIEHVCIFSYNWTLCIMCEPLSMCEPGEDQKSQSLEIFLLDIFYVGSQRWLSKWKRSQVECVGK